MPLPILCACRVKTARMFANFDFGCSDAVKAFAGVIVAAESRGGAVRARGEGEVREPGEEGSAGGCGGADVGGGGCLKAWEETLLSMRWEKRVLRRRVWMWVKAGESMRSDVSSRSRRRVTLVGVFGEGSVVEREVDCCCAADDDDWEMTPDSERT